MGSHHRHSSKRKPSSSSSHRKKKKKSSQDGSKKQSSRDKSKKLHRKHHADDDSLSDSFSNDDHHRGRKRARSRSRKDSNAHRKRVERSPSTSGNSQEEGSIHEKKQKRSRRSSESNVRKRREKKSRSKRSLSSSPSWSRSCSTGSYSKATERKVERNKEWPDRTVKGKRDKHRSRSKRIKHRSESDSLVSGSDSDSRQSRQVIKNEHHPRSLRSVITVKDDMEELGGREFDKAAYKDEIVYDRDEYPTSGSNESYDGVSRREALQHDSRPRFEKTGSLEENIEDGVASNVRNDILSHSNLVRRELLDRETDIVRMARVTMKDNKVEDLTANDDSNEEDLEAILRKKALENLKKYRGGSQAGVNDPAVDKDESKGPVRTSSALKTHPAQQIYDNKEASVQFAGLDSASFVPEETKVTDGKHNVVVPGFVKGDDICHLTTEEQAGSCPSSRGDEAIVSRDKHNAPGGVAPEKPKLEGRIFNKEPHRTKMVWRREPTSKESVLNPSPSLPSDKTVAGLKTSSNADKVATKVESNVASAAVSRNPDKLNASVGAASEKPRPGGRTFDKEIHRTKMILKPAVTSKESAFLNASLSLSSDKNVAGSKTLSNDDKVVTEVESNVAITAAVSTSLNHGAEGQSSKIQQNDVDEESKFEHRTIYVDRGGETVQTSLKVYIPKSTPALARRRLKR